MAFCGCTVWTSAARFHHLVCKIITHVTHAAPSCTSYSKTCESKQQVTHSVTMQRCWALSLEDASAKTPLDIGSVFTHCGTLGTKLQLRRSTAFASLLPNSDMKLTPLSTAGRGYFLTAQSPPSDLSRHLQPRAIRDMRLYVTPDSTSINSLPLPTVVQREFAAIIGIRVIEGTGGG